MAKIQYIKDKDNTTVFPVTHERAVKDSNGVLLETKLNGKQDTLVSGTNIKTVNGENLLGSGNVFIRDGEDGRDGMSAYEIWLDEGNSGTVLDFLESLKGDSGYTGDLSELEVVNDLTTGGSDKALSAQMGVQLKNDLEGKFIFLTEQEFEALSSLDQTKIYCTYET